MEDGKAVVYHTMDNARVHHGAPLRPLEFDLNDAPAVEALLTAYPEPIRVRDLPHPPNEDIMDKLEITESIWKEGILVLDGK